MSAKYRYARTAEGELIEVHSLTDSSRTAGAPFACLSCDREIIPRLGHRNAKHFAHRKDTNCAAETYLHRLAKLVFVETYRKALANGTGFWLRQRVRNTCNYYEREFGYTCEHLQTREIDLTRYFNHAAPEKEHGGYRADVLLSSTQRQEVVFIEMAVTHLCEPEKLAAGFRIIEFHITDEEEVEALRSAVIEEKSGGVRLHNFRREGQAGDYCGGRCDEQVYGFLLYKSGKSILVNDTPIVVHSHLKRSAVYKEMLGRVDGRDPIALFKQKVREMHYTRKLPIRNCFLCPYHGGDGFENAVFCKLRKQSFGSNEAVECDRYRALPSLTHCIELDQKNEQYIQQNMGRMFRRWTLRGLK